MRRLLCATCAAALAAFVLKALGVPWWLDGWTYGDQADAAMMAFFLTWMMMAPKVKP